MRRIAFYSLPILLLTILMIACGSAQKLTLNLMESGVEQYRVSIDRVLEVRRQAEYKTAYESHQIFDIEQETLAPTPEGQFRLKVVFRRIRLQTEVGGEEPIRFDSNGNQQNIQPFLKILFSLLDKPFTLVFSKDGTLERIDGLEAIFQSAVKSLTVSEQRLPNLMEMLRLSYGEGFFGNIYATAFSVFPPPALRDSPQWERDGALTDALLGHLSFKQKCELEDTDNDTVISFSGYIRPELQPARPELTLPQSGLTMALLQGNVNGQVRFNLKKGRLEEMKQNVLLMTGFAGEQNRQPNQKMTITTYLERL